MELNEVNEIIACLPKGRTRFYYFKDRYALMMLGLFADRPVSKHDLRNTDFARLLDKPVVKSALQISGCHAISAESLDYYWPDEYVCYLLSLGVWGSGNRWVDQTSRQGHNLVLQLNFSSEHEAQYRRLIDSRVHRPFECRAHPISKGKWRTLAWARLDIDLDAGEALIEEIQNDWLRKARRWRRRAEWPTARFAYGDTPVRRLDVIQYYDEVLRVHSRFWDEAMLAATIWFLRQELGVRTIWYHTWESGSVLKRIGYRQPPRSVYTTLPRKFCFTETREHPAFLSRQYRKGKARRMLEKARFQVLEWGGG